MTSHHIKTQLQKLCYIAPTLNNSTITFCLKDSTALSPIWNVL